jgi:hypothetical protein
VGTDAADAALDAGLDMREVKRCMPVAVVEDEKTPEEVERLRATRLAALAKARAVRAAEREIEQQIERRKVKQ